MNFPVFARMLIIVAMIMTSVLWPSKPAAAAGVMTVVSSETVFMPGNIFLPSLASPMDAVVNPSTGHLIVANWFCDNLCTLSTFNDDFSGLSHQGLRITDSGLGFGGDTMLAFNPRTNRLWKARESGDFNPSALVDTPSGLQASGGVAATINATLTDIDVNPTTNHVFTTGYRLEDGGAAAYLFLATDSDVPSEVNRGRYVVPLDGHYITGPIAVNPVTNNVFVVNTVEGTVEVFRDESFVDTSPPEFDKPAPAVRHVATIPDIGPGQAIAVNPNTGTVFIATPDGVALVRDHGDSLSVGSTLSVGADPLAIAVNANTGRVYVANYGQRSGAFNPSVSIIEDLPSTSPRVLGSAIPLPSRPVAITVNPVTNHVFVVLLGDSQIVMLGDLVPTTMTAPTVNATTKDTTVKLEASVWLGPASGGDPLTRGVVTFTVMTPDRSGQLGQVSGGLFETGRSVVDFLIPSGTPPGTYPVRVQYGDATGINGFSETETSLVIRPATLNVRANDVTWVAGSPQPALTYTITGFASGDDESIVTGEPNLFSVAGPAPRAGDYDIFISGSLTAPGYEFSYTQGILSVEFPEMQVSPAAAQVGAASLDLAVHGAGFGNGMDVRWNGIELATTLVSHTELRATVSGSLLTEQGMGIVDVVDKIWDRASPRAAVFVTTSGADVTGSDLATGTSASDTVTAVAGGVTASATGSGTIVVAQYAANPGGDVIFGDAGGYFDVNVTPDSSFSQVVVTTCDVASGQTIAYWWDGSGWRIVSDQFYDAATGCIAMTLSGSTSPSLAQLTGTPFAVGGKLLQTIDFPAVSDRLVGGAPVTLSTTASSGLPVSYTAGPSSVCTVSGAVVTLVGPGACTVTASQAGDGLYGAAQDVQQSFTISYAFSGFFSPMENLPIINAAKAGQTIPIRWELRDANGNSVSDPDSFTSITATSLSCDGGSTTSLVTEVAAGSSGLQYLGDGQWQFNWKTPKSYAGSCKTLVLTLADGSQHTAAFSFNK